MIVIISSYGLSVWPWLRGWVKSTVCKFMMDFAVKESLLYCFALISACGVMQEQRNLSVTSIVLSFVHSCYLLNACGMIAYMCLWQMIWLLVTWNCGLLKCTIDH